MRDACGVLDLPGFSRFMVEGAGAAEWLRGQVTGGIPKVGRIGLGYFADDRGRIVTEMTLMRLEDDKFMLITAATAELHDREWLERSKPESVSLRDMTEAFSCQIVTGPKSRDVLADMGVPADVLAAPWLNHHSIQINEV